MNRLVITTGVIALIVLLLAFFILPAIATATIGSRVVLPGFIYLLLGIGLSVGAIWTWRIASPASLIEKSILAGTGIAGLALILKTFLVTF